jgi:signal peptidase
MRRSANLLGWVALLLIVGGWVVFARPPALGGGTEFVFVRGDSMLPTFDPGDLVVVRQQHHYDVGDVVAFHVPGSKARVIHRIIGTTADGYTMRGDNRPGPDPWTPTDDEVAGGKVLRIPGLGARLIQLAQTPMAIATLAAALAVFVAVGVRDEPAERPEPAAGDPTPASPRLLDPSGC